jgi:hypothetical protein
LRVAPAQGEFNHHGRQKRDDLLAPLRSVERGKVVRVNGLGLWGNQVLGERDTSATPATGDFFWLRFGVFDNADDQVVYLLDAKPNAISEC